MIRPITLASGQFGDMGLEELCAMASSIGYQGLELATHAHFNVEKALKEEGYVDQAYRKGNEKYKALIKEGYERQENAEKV